MVDLLDHDAARCNSRISIDTTGGIGAHREIVALRSRAVLSLTRCRPSHAISLQQALNGRVPKILSKAAPAQ